MQLKYFFRLFSYCILMSTISLTHCSEKQCDVFNKIKEKKDIEFLNTDQVSKYAEYIAKTLIIRIIINMDNETKKCLKGIEHFLSKHTDIKNKIQSYINKLLLRTYATLYTKQNTCTMSSLHGRSRLLYPMNFNDSLLTFTSSSARSFSFNKSLWMAWRNIIHVRDDNEKIIKILFFNFQRHQQSFHKVMVDGPNKQGDFVIAINSEQELNKSNLFIANIEDLSSDTSRIEPFKKIDGYIKTIMIHPTQNIIVYSCDIDNDGYNNEYALHMLNPLNASFNLSSPADFGCKKISFFGGGTYIFLTLQGQLGMCWLKKGKDNETIMQWSLKKHTSTYVDFAPDTSLRTQSGFARHWAFLTGKGEVFMCDFLNTLVDKPTLFLAIQADEPKKRVGESFYKLYCNDGTCGVVDQYKGTSADRFIIHS